jgi:hypothetical protein
VKKTRDRDGCAKGQVTSSIWIPSEACTFRRKSEAIYKHFNSGLQLVKINEVSCQVVDTSVKFTGTVRSEAAPSLTTRRGGGGWRAGAWLKSMDGGPWPILSIASNTQ